MPRTIYSVPQKIRDRVFLMFTNGKRNIEAQRATGIDKAMADVLRRYWKDHINPAGPQSPPAPVDPDTAGPWPPGWRKPKVKSGSPAAREQTLRRKQQAREQASDPPAREQTQEEAPAPAPAAGAAVPVAGPPGLPIPASFIPPAEESDEDRSLREQYLAERASSRARKDEKDLDLTLRLYRKELRKALPIHERAKILTELARAESPQVAIRAIEMVDGIEGLGAKVKDQAPAAPGPMIVLPVGSAMAIAPIRRDRE